MAFARRATARHCGCIAPTQRRLTSQTQGPALEESTYVSIQSGHSWHRKFNVSSVANLGTHGGDQKTV